MNKTSQFVKLTAPYKNELLKGIKEWCAINSQYDESTRDEANPFGKGVSDALAYFANLAKEAGFNVTNHDNYLVEATFGEGKKNITVMAHADVVPAGTGWETDPFQVVEKKGILYGRGVADDKGPALSCFYALKALKDNNMLSDKYQIRFLVGGNEESGSLCMEHYFKSLKKPQPTYGFSPDSSFPLIFAEKAIFNFELSTKLNVIGLVSIHGGFASNAVMEKCSVNFELNDALIPYLLKNYPDAEITTNDDIVTITFIGKAAHGSVPQLGENAGLKALDFLAKYTKAKVFIQAYDLLKDVYGRGVNAYASSKDMGENSLNFGLINYEKGESLNMVINFRYVDGIDDKEIKSRIKEACKPFTVKFTPTSPLLYFDRRSKLVKALMTAYIEETGDIEARPLSTGGGTYAKEAENVVAFGMEFNNRDPKMHAPGENVSVDDLMDAMAIYAHAFIELGKLIDEN